MGAVGPNWLENFTAGLTNGTIGPCPPAWASKSVGSNWNGLGVLPHAISNMKDALLQQQVTLVKDIKKQLKVFTGIISLLLFFTPGVLTSYR